MDEAYLYEIRVEGQLAGRWREWFEGMAIRSEEGQSVLSGVLPDQAALFGVLRKVHDLNLVLVAVTRCLHAVAEDDGS